MRVGPCGGFHGLLLGVRNINDEIDVKYHQASKAPFTGDIKQFATEDTQHTVSFLFPVLTIAESPMDMVTISCLPRTHRYPFCRKQ